jgi:hypothetical protein
VPRPVPGPSNTNGGDPWAVTDILPTARQWFFCRVGECRYWHPDPKPSQTTPSPPGRTLPGPARMAVSQLSGQLSGVFKKKRGVNAHCKAFPECAQALALKRDEIESREFLVSEEDLVQYDLRFHIPYRLYDGRSQWTTNPK